MGSWNGACAAAGSNAQCALTNIQADQVSTVSFALIPPATYTVTATAADPYGTASCLPNNVKAGGEQHLLRRAPSRFPGQELDRRLRLLG